MKSDREFLIWLHKRLVNVHGENELYDYMHRFRAIIRNTPRMNRSASVDGKNSLEELLKDE